jgi:hypothetical protein
MPPTPMSASRAKISILVCLVSFLALCLWMGIKLQQDSQTTTQQTAQQGPVPENWETGLLSANQTMLMSISIEPWSEKNIRLPQRPAMVGLRVKEALELLDQRKKDEKDHVVYLTRLNDGEFIGTFFEGCTDFGEILPDEEFNVKNKTPFTVSVIIFGGER